MPSRQGKNCYLLTFHGTFLKLHPAPLLLLLPQVPKTFKECLVKSRRQTRLRVEHATGWNVRRRLSAGCQILHFAGHGCDQFLAFEAEEAHLCGVVKRFDVSDRGLMNGDDACAFSQVCRHVDSRKMFPSRPAPTGRARLHPLLTILSDNHITPPGCAPNTI